MRFENKLSRAIELHREGNILGALEIYKNLLNEFPNHLNLNFFLGTALVQLSRPEDAIPFLEKCISLEPRFADAHYNYGIALEKLEKYAEAEVKYSAAVDLDPKSDKYINNLGVVNLKLNRETEAIDMFSRACSINPNNIDACYNLCKFNANSVPLNKLITLYDKEIVADPLNVSNLRKQAHIYVILRDYLRALKNYNRAIQINPECAEVYDDLGQLGILTSNEELAIASYKKAIELNGTNKNYYLQYSKAFEEFERYQDAIHILHQLITIDPGFAGAYLNLGNMYSYMGAIKQSEQMYGIALGISQTKDVVYNNLGTLHLKNDELQLAKRYYDLSLAINANNYESNLNLGIVYQGLGELVASIDSYNKCIHLRPTDKSAYWNKALCYLTYGDFSNGWALYEHGLNSKLRNAKFPENTKTLSDTRDAPGKSIYVSFEQGIGDSFQMYRYVQELHSLGADVTFEVPAYLIPIFYRSNRDIKYVGESQPHLKYDYCIAMMSLPYLFKSQLNTIPSKIPYIRADQTKVLEWKNRLNPSGFKIGICWQGSTNKEVDRGRSFPVNQFIGLSKILGVRLISLHKGAGENQLKELPQGMHVETFGSDFDSNGGAFMDTAAVMKVCDLIITCDTSVAHLAGALGVPVWLALKRYADWRWMRDRSDSPWYPTMRLFRQTQPGDWNSVFSEIEMEVRKLI